MQMLAKSPRPARPGYCSIGQTVRIKVNHFEVKCNLTQAFHYDVVLSRPRKSKSYPPQVCWCCRFVFES